MLQGHVFHSFLKPELRDGSHYVLSQFLGGMPPAIFLFLTGVTLSFLMDSGERKSLSATVRWVTALRRAGYLFGLAFLFRFQLWVFGLPDSPWTDLFRVDILNCMGFAMAMLSVMALFRTAQRVRFCAAAGLVIAAASPLVSRLDWSGVPALVKHYIAPDYAYFSFFPWAAFLAFGMSAGSLIRILKSEYMDRAMQWAALAGCALIVGARYFSELPYSLYSNSDFWLNSPAQVLIKTGVILLLLALAFLWTHLDTGENSWSWVRQFGTTSLLVYWVHIELVYGRWLFFLKEKLDVTQTIVAAVIVILLMLGLSVAKTNRDRWVPRLQALRLPWYPAEPDRVPGD